jgi:hypothetical protein
VKLSEAGNAIRPVARGGQGGGQLAEANKRSWDGEVVVQEIMGAVSRIDQSLGRGRPNRRCFCFLNTEVLA